MDIREVGTERPDGKQFTFDPIEENQRCARGVGG
jgi:hypothetical protein